MFSDKIATGRMTGAETHVDLGEVDLGVEVKTEVIDENEVSEVFLTVKTEEELENELDNNVKLENCDVKVDDTDPLKLETDEKDSDHNSRVHLGERTVEVNKWKKLYHSGLRREIYQLQQESSMQKVSHIYHWQAAPNSSGVAQDEFSRWRRSQKLESIVEQQLPDSSDFNIPKLEKIVVYGQMSKVTNCYKTFNYISTIQLVLF